MSELSTKQITLNFRRMSKKTVEAMGVATLGIEDEDSKSGQEVDPKTFMNASELKGMKILEDKMKELKAEARDLQKELKQPDSGLLGSLKNAVTGRKVRIQARAKAMERDMQDIHMAMADFVMQSRMRALKERDAGGSMISPPAPPSLPSP